MKNYLKNQIIYQVFARNFTEKGTFKEFNKHIDYIKNLGTTIVYFTPISPIGKVGRKGDLGSPYAIQDYMAINPELGTFEDFKETIDLIHKAGMKVMIDIVYNHTSRDSLLLKKHPNWFYKNEKGEVDTKVSDWSDVYDLDYTDNKENNKLITYLLGVLEHYIKAGVDGFRFDVCSLVGLNFYKRMKDELLTKYPETIVLGEAIDTDFTTYMRSQNFAVVDDATLYMNGFDLLYEYNTFSLLRRYLETGDLHSLEQYKAVKSYEYAVNPQGALRIRCIENHDQKRICQFTNNPLKERNLAAMAAFMGGPMFIYNGLETKADHHLSLFTKDNLDLSIDLEWYNFIKLIVDYKKKDKQLLLTISEVSKDEGEHIVIKNNYSDKTFDLGIFNLTGHKELIKDSMLVDGIYKDHFTKEIVVIQNHQLIVDRPLYLERNE